MDKKSFKKQVNILPNLKSTKIIEEMLSKQGTKQEIWKEYTGEEVEHGQLLRSRQAYYQNNWEGVLTTIEENLVIQQVKNIQQKYIRISN